MVKGFREFLLRGNVVDLAVAVVIGTAFGVVVSALVKDFLTPVVAAIVGKPDFSALTFEINSSTFRYGDFFNALLNFLFVAAAIYFFVVVPMQKLMSMRAKPATDISTRDCPECLSTIPRAASRCSFCTAQVGAAA